MSNVYCNLKLDIHICGKCNLKKGNIDNFYDSVVHENIISSCSILPCPYAKNINYSVIDNVYNSNINFKFNKLKNVMYEKYFIKRKDSLEFVLYDYISDCCPYYVDHIFSFYYNKGGVLDKDKSKKRNVRFNKNICKICKKSWNKFDEKLWKKYRKIWCNNNLCIDKFLNIYNYPFDDNCIYYLEQIVC